jgi:urea transporter
MSAKQVNAWGSYEQTAAKARPLSNNNVKKTDGRGAREAEGLLLQVSNNSCASKGSDGSSLYRRDACYEVEPRKGLFETLLLEKGILCKKLEYEQIEEKKRMMSESLIESIRQAFRGFFDAADGPKKTHEFSLVSLIRSIDATMPWVQSQTQSQVFLFFEMCLRGICQIYFQNNPVSGLFFLVAFFVQSSRIAVHAVIGVISSTLFARFMRFDKGLASSGLFGYNGALAGLAIATFDSAETHGGYKATTIVATIVFSATTSILLVMLGKLLVPYKVPCLTLPFNISVLFFLLAVAGMGHVDYSSVRPPALPDYDAAVSSGISLSAFLAGTIRGVGQVCLCDSIGAGVLMLAGIAVCSRISALSAFIGSGIGAAVALLVGVPDSQIELGMFGFNASLSFTAMLMFYTPSVGAATFGVLSAGLTVVAQLSLQTALEPFGLPFMTLPFCLVALMFILIQGTTSVVIAVPLSSMTTPEDHLERVYMLSDGVAFLKDSIDTETALRMSGFKSRQLQRTLRNMGKAISEWKSEETQTAEESTRSKRCSWLGMPDAEAEMRATAASIFQALDGNQNGEILMQEVTDAFQVAGLSDEEHLHFAHLILSLMDLDGNGTIDVTEFAAFVLVAQAVNVIRVKITKFLDFVDMDGSGGIDLEEINGALDYLGQPQITEADMSELRKLTECEDESIEIVALINAIIVAKVRSFIDAFHNRATEQGNTSKTCLDQVSDKPRRNPSKESTTAGSCETSRHASKESAWSKATSVDGPIERIGTFV